MRQLILRKLKELDDVHPDPDETYFDGLRNMLSGVERQASLLGLDRVVAACQIRSGGISVGLARKVLARCLAAIPSTPKPTLTPPELAKEWRVSPDKILAWIRNGELKAKNVSGGNRPRYIIDRKDIESFRPPKEKPERRSRRRRNPHVIDFCSQSRTKSTTARRR